MQEGQQNPYEFIMDPGQQQKPGLNFGDKKRQTIIGIVFVLVVLMVVWIAVTLIFSSGGSSAGLTKVRAHQIEIDRVVELGQKDLAEPAVRQQLATLQTTIQSDLKQIADLSSSRGQKASKEELASQKNTKIDSELTAAASRGNFDEVLIDSVDTLVEKYYVDLKQTRQDSGSKKEQALLDTAIANLETIYQDVDN